MGGGWVLGFSNQDGVEWTNERRGEGGKEMGPRWTFRRVKHATIRYCL